MVGLVARFLEIDGPDPNELGEDLALHDADRRAVDAFALVGAHRSLSAEPPVPTNLIDTLRGDFAFVGGETDEFFTCCFMIC